MVSGGVMLAGIVLLGALGESADGGMPTDVAGDRVAADAAVAAPASRPPVSPAPGIEPDQGLVVTSPAAGGEEITTRRLQISGYVVGAPVAVRISLQGRREREIESVTVFPLRSPDLTRPQRAGRFEVWFDLPNPRPNGRMVVEVALVAPDGRVIDMTRRRIQVGAIGGLSFRTISGQSPARATRGPAVDDRASRARPRPSS